MRGQIIPIGRLPIDAPGFSTPGTGDRPTSCAGRMLSKGKHLYRAGDPAAGPHLVISGALKGYSIDCNGHESVLRLYSEGDVLGLEALARRPALTSVVALDTTKVRRLSEHIVRAAYAQVSSTTDLVALGVYQELRQSNEILAMNRGPTDARLARFLLRYGEKQALRGCKQYEFLLPFGRRDLAHYLGLATETLSRIFGRLQKRSVLDVDNHHIVVLDLKALRGIASGSA